MFKNVQCLHIASKQSEENFHEMDPLTLKAAYLLDLHFKTIHDNHQCSITHVIFISIVQNKILYNIIRTDMCQLRLVV